jgi:hypothetical protein
MPIEFDAEQAKDVMGNPQNEHHQRYKSNDRQVVEAVSQGLLKGDASLKNLSEFVELPVTPPADYKGRGATLFRQQPSGLPIEVNEPTPLQELQPQKNWLVAEQPQWNPSDGFDREFEWTEEQAVAHLKQEWGSNFNHEAQYLDAFNKAAASYPDQKVYKQAGVLLGNHPGVVKLIVHVVKTLKGVR